MKHVFAVILLLFMYAAAKAQPDPLNYYVVLKDSSDFACKIPYRKQGQIIKAVKLDSTEAYIGWGRISTIYLVTDDGRKLDENTIAGTELEKIKKRERAIIKKRNWVGCFMVLFKGDTLYGKSDPEKDYSITGSYNEWSKEYWFVNEIEIESDGRGDQAYKLAQVKEIEIADSVGVIKYFNVKGDMYKVVVDGDVKLLSRRKLPNAAKSFFVPPVFPTSDAIENGSFAWGPTGGYVMGTETRKFFLYKSGAMYELKTQTGFVRVTDDFAEDCETIFEGCPAVIARINAQKGRNVNLKSITEEYNVCIKQ